MDWILTTDKKPLCFESGSWDGLRSEQIVCEDEFGERYLAECYEGFIDGSQFFDWFEKNGFSIETKIVRWIKLPL